LTRSSLHAAPLGAKLGDELGDRDGSNDGDADGDVDGCFVVGAVLGASVLVQQPKNVSPSAVGQQSWPARRPRERHTSCCEQSPDVVGDDVGNVVGDGVGCAVGALVLSQQEKNVLPSAAGQHCPPRSPSAEHRGQTVQSAALVGLAVGAAVGETDGTLDGDAEGDPDGTLVGRGETQTEPPPPSPA
jgi:hypothetical protein